MCRGKNRSSRRASCLRSCSLRSPRLRHRTASDCPHQGVLGTARILAVDPAAYPRVGLKSFPQTLPLRDHEVVLTFDDGPSPPNTPQGACGAGKGMRARDVLPDRQAGLRTSGAGAADRGRTAHRSAITHGRIPSLKQLKPSETTEEIDRGIAADEMALHGVATTTPSTPFFRFPYFELHAGNRSTCCSRAESRYSALTCGPATGAG